MYEYVSPVGEKMLYSLADKTYGTYALYTQVRILLQHKKVRGVTSFADKGVNGGVMKTRCWVMQIYPS